MINYDDYDYDVYQSNVHDLNQGLDSVIYQWSMISWGDGAFHTMQPGWLPLVAASVLCFGYVLFNPLGFQFDIQLPSGYLT